MTLKFDTKWTSSVQAHLNSNPRVLSYRENADGELTVAYDPSLDCPLILQHEARALGLGELAANKQHYRGAA